MQLRNYEGSLEIKIWPKKSNRWASWRTITVYMSWLRVSLLAVITYPGVWKWNIENNLLYEDFIWTQSCFGPRISNLCYIPFSILANIQCRHCSAMKSGSNISSHSYILPEIAAHLIICYKNDTQLNSYTILEYAIWFEWRLEVVGDIWIKLHTAYKN